MPVKRHVTALVVQRGSLESIYAPFPDKDQGRDEAPSLNQEISSILFPLQKELLYPRSISFSVSLNPEDRKIDLDHLADALSHSRNITGLNLDREDLEELVSLLKNHTAALPSEEALCPYADSISISHSRNFRLLSGECRSRIHSQLNLSQGGLPVFTDFALEINRRTGSRAPYEIVFRLSWPERWDRNDAFESIRWRMADSILLELTGAPLPPEFKGEEYESGEYEITVTDNIRVGVSYIPESTEPFSPALPFSLSSALLSRPAEIPLEDEVEEGLTEKSPPLHISTCVAGKIEILSPSPSELRRGLMAINIELPPQLTSYLIETVRDNATLDQRVMESFSALGESVRISQVSMVRYTDDGPDEDEDPEEEDSFEEDEDDLEASDELEEEQEEEEDSESEFDLEQRDAIDISLDLPPQQDSITVSLQLVDEPADLISPLIVTLEFSSVSNVFLDEQIAERWRLAQDFITAFNGPEIPQDLSDLELRKRNGTDDALQLDDQGRIFITPEPS